MSGEGWSSKERGDSRALFSTHGHREKAMCGLRENVAFYKPLRAVSPETQTTNTLILDFKPPELWRNKCLLFKPHSLWYFVRAAQADGSNSQQQTMESGPVHSWAVEQPCGLSPQAPLSPYPFLTGPADTNLRICPGKQLLYWVERWVCAFLPISPSLGGEHLQLNQLYTTDLIQGVDETTRKLRVRFWK